MVLAMMILFGCQDVVIAKMAFFTSSSLVIAMMIILLLKFASGDGIITTMTSIRGVIMAMMTLFANNDHS